MLASEGAQELKQAGVIGHEIVDVLHRENDLRIVLSTGQTIVFFGHAGGLGLFVEDAHVVVSGNDQGWLAERLRVEKIAVSCSPLAQRLFSLVSDIITIAPDKCCLASLKTLAKTLRANSADVRRARDELIKAGALHVHFVRNERNAHHPRRVFTLPCGTRPLKEEEHRETVKELLARVRSENDPCVNSTEDPPAANRQPGRHKSRR